MDEGLREQALEWFVRGDREIETAQLLYDHRWYTDIIAYHVQQAVEKYLKGYLVLKGQRPPWVHELDRLLADASRLKADLYPRFIELCEKATRYYLEDRYPPGPAPEYTHDEIKADLDHAWELIQIIKREAVLP
ncbi:MAG: HEPN domain-containing protein [Planctomycetes bacterium]|nr:HEPN domain-containing protein [Planctomycetota bacterium]MBM4078916.1 HEPN domain-containing protein [Planctomycetota bacterium]